MATVSEETTTICTHCDRPIPSGNIDLHTVHCGRNLEKCKVCGDMVPKKHAEEHYFNTHAPDICGNRTEHCYRCARYIRLRDRYVHETTCNGVSEAPLGTSRDFRPAAEREPRPRRRDTPAPAFPKRHLLITIAITGIAFILGSFFYQKKSENSTGH
uniref:TRAF-type domain-containing protein n=1 Tax=Chenopodium quinoa TaxID=63459 RepID=A0A803LV77_CHEQI